MSKADFSCCRYTRKSVMNTATAAIRAIRQKGLVAATLLLLFIAGNASADLGLQNAVFGTPPPSVSKLLEIAQKGKDVYEKAKPLDDSSPDTQPDYDPPGMPQIPVGCGSAYTDVATTDCAKCYEKAHKSLRKLRINFEQLRILYSETDEFTKASIAFGDGIAGSVGVGALQWTVERESISASFKGFKKVYKNKYDELLKKLDETLHEIGVCETRYFGDTDWYNRYGFIFQSFMAMHYNRN